MNTLQELNSDYCGPFQLYFYYNLFEPYENSIVAHRKNKKLDYKLLQNLLNEMLTRNSVINKRIIDGFIMINKLGLDEDYSEMSEEDT